MTPHTLRLGTRGSELALKQAEMVEATLRAAHPELHVERVVIATTGDKRPDLRFKEFTDGDRLDKGIFTKELEFALHDGSIDIAVHSLKDVPTVLDEAFLIAAVLERAPIEDVLISRDGYTLETLPPGAKIGTSSVRRIRQIHWLRPDVECVEIRGNVPTRIKKLQLPSDLDAILLAKAGLVRLGLLSSDTGLQPVGETDILSVPSDSTPPTSALISPQSLADNISASPTDKMSVSLPDFPITFPAAILPCGKFLPAAGQGAIGIEARKTDSVTLAYLAAINHAPTFARISTEREFLHLLHAGCQTPIGAHTEIIEDTLTFTAWVFDEQTPDAPPQVINTSAPLTQPLLAASQAAAEVTR
ncbi:hydroxymethylbilane synthase [Phragmitibacter flavus]|uniref:Hydroxymethylbilane synthase n=1 Tax=Phragmitibacter flavus TaxID=2576071 RepID=A0A5R8KEJ3_9BACT|nr:hydroxymethylbilane synthase [Phragmitibacter flavus]TLD70405.1 hydroxymethylbilane synthase [Phragmitibacter flavus]